MEGGKRHTTLLGTLSSGHPRFGSFTFSSSRIMSQALSLKRTGLAPDFSIDVNLKMHEINEDISQGPITLHTIK